VSTGAIIEVGVGGDDKVAGGKVEVTIGKVNVADGAVFGEGLHAPNVNNIININPIEVVLLMPISL